MSAGMPSAPNLEYHGETGQYANITRESEQNEYLKHPSYKHFNGGTVVWLIRIRPS